MNKKIKQVWEKATEVPGYPKDKIRKDAWGAWIIFSEYNKTNSPYGWVVDHIYPQERCTIREIEHYDNIVNLRPMQWKNARDKGNEFPYFHATVTSRGERNVPYDDLRMLNNNGIKELRKVFKF